MARTTASTRSAASSRTSAATRTGGCINPRFEEVPIYVVDQIQSGFIDGTATGDTSSLIKTNYWYLNRSATTIAVRYDPAVYHSGAYSLKLDLTDATGGCFVNDIRGTSITRGPTYISANTRYTFTCWVKTTNIAANGAYATVQEFGAASNLLATNTTNKVSGTNDWTKLTVSFTTNANSVYRIVNLFAVAGNVATVWYDDISLVASRTAIT